MIGVSTRVRTDVDAAAAVEAGVRDGLMDAATAGANTALEHTPSGATNTLRASWFPPHERADGSIEWGYRAAYARFVETGTRPHWPPIAPLLKWARRVLGDESAAYAVQRHIAEEGTEGQHFVRNGVDAMRARLVSKGLSAHITERL